MAPPDLPIFGPDITPDEARAILSKKLKCKPEDVVIIKTWTVLAPNPNAVMSDHRDERLREEAGMLKQAVQRIVTLAESP